MPAMLQDGRVIVVVFVAFSLLIGTNLASSENVKCRYCKELIQSLLTNNNPLRFLMKVYVDECNDEVLKNEYNSNLVKLFEEKSSFAEKFFENIAEENVPITSKLDFVIFCLDNCVASGHKTENDENNSIRSKRDVTEGIYKYFSPPFSHMTNDQSEQGVSEVAEELEDTAKSYESSRRAYQGYVRDKRIGSSCECVREQEESVKRLMQMVEKYTQRVIELFRGMVREEIKNQVLPQRRGEISSVGHQQNYFMISILTPNPPNLLAQFVKPGTFPAMEATTAGQVVEEPETHATRQANTELTMSTTEMPAKGTEAMEETTTEVTIDLPEANIMRQSDDELPPDCDNMDHESSQYLPALLQAFRPENT